MGLLDDAIREHLDLKRRRGADPGEIERQEAEALGPVRRGDVDLAEPAGAVEPEDAVDDDRGPVADVPVAHDPLDDLEPPVPSAPPVTHDAPYAEPEDESATPPHGDPWQQQPTREFSADELSEALRDHRDDEPVADGPAAGGEGDEDVLEETPDFLQETPEHDRLWFEQKPPKDFDF